MAGVVVYLLLLVLAARADPRGDACAADPRRPTVSATTARKKNTMDSRGNRIEAEYGETVTVFCSADDIGNLTIHNEEEYLQGVPLNSNTLQFSITNLKEGYYEYRCKDSRTGCEATMAVAVAPVPAVSAARAHHALDVEGNHVFFVPLGEDYDIFCSGNEDNLHGIGITVPYVKFTVLPSVSANRTTVKYRAQAVHIGENYYMCLFYSSRQQFTVVVDHYPEGRNFSCILHQWRKLVCSWNSSTTSNNYKLFYTDLENKRTRLLCADSSVEEPSTCVWNSVLEKGKIIFRNQNFSLLLQTCNDIFCNNQTFFINSDMITKLDPVSVYSVFDTSPHGASLRWEPFRTEFYSHLPITYLTYKVDYRLKLFGEKWQQADMASLACDRSNCRVQLAFLYPASPYEARVYAQLNKVVAVEERLWSEPTSVTLKTKARAECACDAPRAAQALCEACTLKGQTIEDMLALRKAVSSLKKKRDKINQLAKLIDAINVLYEN